MGRLWTCGFELQSTSAEFGVNSGAVVTGSPSISTTVHRAGTASLRSNTTNATAYVEHQLTGGVVMRTFHRFYLRIDSLPSTATNIYGIGQSGYFPALLRIQTDGTLVLRDGYTETTLTGTSPALTLGRWYRVELDYTDVDNGGALAAGIAPFKGYLDGVQFADTMCSNITGFSRIRMGVQLAATTDIYIDDVAVNDTTGTVQNGLPGPGSVVHLRPNAAGDNNLWATAVGGTAGAANNWTRVSERTPDDATSYNQTSASGTTTIDDFKMESPTTAGIGATDTITLVQVGGRVASSATTAASIVYRLKGQAGGTVVESPSVSVANTAWSVHSGVSPRPYQLTAYTNPQTGTAWTPTTLGTAQVGYRGNVSQTSVRRVSTLWALAEFVPDEGGDEPTAYTTVTGPAKGGTTATTSQTSHTVTVTGAVAGETIVLLVASGNAAVSSVSSAGMTWTQDASTVWYSYLYAYSAPVTASGTVTITVTTSAASNATSQAYRVTGITARDRTATGHDSNGSPSLTTAATSQANEVVFGAFSVFAGTGTDVLTPAADYTGSSSNNTPTSGQTVTLNSLWQAVGTIGAQTPSGTLDYASTWDGLAVTYKTSTPPPPVARPADTGTLTDSATAKRDTTGRQFTAADTSTLADTAAAARALPRAAADGTTLADTAAAARQQLRSPADTGLLSDQTARTLTQARAAADAGQLADSSAAAAARTRGPADSGALADTTVAARAKPAADGASLGDQATPIRGRAQTSGDTAILADAHATARASSPADTGTLKDSPVAARTTERAPADPAALSDKASPARGTGRTDTALVTDTAEARRSAATADSTVLADTALAATVRPGTAGDAAALADTTVPVAARARASVDSAVLGDTAAASRYRASTERPADPAALGDTSAATAGRARTGTDTTSLADTAVSKRAATVADTAALTDRTVTAQARTAGAVDGISLADTSAVTSSRARTVADTASSTNDAGTSQSSKETFHTRDPAALGDTSVATASRARTATDGTAATDAAAAGRALPGTDGGILADQATSVYGHVTAPADTAVLGDAVAAAQTRGGALVDTGFLRDAGDAARSAVRAPGDGGLLADQASGDSGRARTAGDGGTLADHADAGRGTSATDAGLLIDTASPVMGRGQGAADALVVVDAVAAVYQRAVAVSDAAGLADEDARALAAFRAAGDVLDAGDSASAVPVHGFADTAQLTSTVEMLADRARTVRSKAALTDRVVAHRRGPLDIVLTAVPLPARWDTALLPSRWDLPVQPSGWETQLLEDG
ncbi:beta strand repeat-containing protein [Streptomyces sp. NPDC094153]|uniref:beta strand repeat-containing protein n=1 Tax=Streptomyces sp. NPDC094153 TaxID=3366058 RepID=UPI00380CD9A7